MALRLTRRQTVVMCLSLSHARHTYCLLYSVRLSVVALITRPVHWGLVSTKAVILGNLVNGWKIVSHAARVSLGPIDTPRQALREKLRASKRYGEPLRIQQHLRPSKWAIFSSSGIDIPKEHPCPCLLVATYCNASLFNHGGGRTTTAGSISLLCESF